MITTGIQGGTLIALVAAAAQDEVAKETITRAAVKVASRALDENDLLASSDCDIRVHTIHAQKNIVVTIPCELRHFFRNIFCHTGIFKLVSAPAMPVSMHEHAYISYTAHMHTQKNLRPRTNAYNLTIV